MRNGRRRAACAFAVPMAAVTAALTLVGCGGSDDGPTRERRERPTTSPDARRGPWGDGGKAAEAGRTVGAPGSPCTLPVAFSAARGWKAESVPKGTHRQGTVEVACEIDAKPAGNIGYLRVWTGDGDSPRAALEAFAEDRHPERRRHRTTEAGDGGTALAEVSYLSRTVLDGEELDRKPVLAFAADTGDGRLVIVELGGTDAEEHRAMLPAYLLAKKTLKVRG
ncbi:hypothetical protein GCM10009801_10220 [Streptomyces albiaxialis]|uniref:Lipoprotein n=1 Tax=Streptomyces albiaxialis TaxID=329523 RepID=A0ABN2VL30_9ACTN